MSRHSVSVLLATFLLGCGGQGECDAMLNTIARATANMIRTTAAGSNTSDLPIGTPIPSLQVNELSPDIYTIQFEGMPPDTDGFSAYAIINWKIGGQQITRKVSVFSGAAISGVCEAVDVKLVDVSNIAFNALGADPYKIAANLSRGQRAATMQPAVLYTQPSIIVTAALNGAPANFVVPQGAGVISVMVNNALGTGAPLAPPATDVVAAALDSFGNNLQVWYPNLQNPGWVPVPGTTKTISVLNRGPSDSLVNVVWGVEG